MARIFSPNSDFSGYRLGVTFTRGVGESTDPQVVDAFRHRGWDIEDESESQTAERPTRASTKAQWVDYAEQHGFDRDNAEAMTKDDLIEALSARGND